MSDLGYVAKESHGQYVLTRHTREVIDLFVGTALVKPYEMNAHGYVRKGATEFTVSYRHAACSFRQPGCVVVLRVPRKLTASGIWFRLVAIRDYLDSPAYA